MDSNAAPKPGSSPSRKDKLLLRQAQIAAQLKDIAARERNAKRTLDDHKKFSIGGHFLPLIEKLSIKDLTANDILPDEVLAKALLAHMEWKMTTKHHRKVLGLSERQVTEPTKENGSTEG
ncbi:hypothetical protein F183_A55240 (plasmid) [Bryobacterales bacterium F-183]|nr:hypothetical protein F183_A55240 [Bryobacterales bacterium F-183]